MANRSPAFWPTVVIIASILITVLALPQSLRSWLPAPLSSPAVHLGLDLAGGTQLDFRISEDEIQAQTTDLQEEILRLKNSNASQTAINELEFQIQVVGEQQRNLVEAIRTVLERRINSLGVSETTITPSYVGQEKHLLVECPGVIDVQQCIATVGKTIQLEFKEEFTAPTPEFEQNVRDAARGAMERITKERLSLDVLGQDLGDDLGMAYQPGRWFFRDQLPPGLDAAWPLKSGIVTQLEGSVPSQRQNEEGQMEEIAVPGMFLVEPLGPRTQSGRTVNEAPKAFTILQKSEANARYTFHEKVPVDPLSARVSGTLRAMQPGQLQVAAADDGTASIIFLSFRQEGQEQMEASHILIAYKGASGAPATLTRSKEEARGIAEELSQKLRSGGNFEQLAREYSDGPSGAQSGRLGLFSRATMVPTFSAAAFALTKGQLSDPTETEFGFHIIRADRSPFSTSDIVSFDELRLTGIDAESRAHALLAKLQSGDVKTEEEMLRLRFLFFSLQPTGWQDTALDGKHFRSAAVTTDPSTNLPVVQILFDTEGGSLFQELTKRNVGKRIAIFVGGELVSAPTVQNEIAGGSAIITGVGSFDEAQTLAQDLNTGAIPAPIHLAGQRTVEPSLGAEALTMSIKAGLVGIMLLMLYMLLVYRGLGLLANTALLAYALAFLAMLKLPLLLITNQYIVLTLAGAAGMILSIGMAVDTNVLVFERVKEELRKGKMLRTAIEVGFTKAWPSIRDSNLATIISCTLLFMIGTSIVRGFAVTLGLGVLMSMVTGLLLSKWLARKLAQLPTVENNWFFFTGERTRPDLGPRT